MHFQIRIFTEHKLRANLPDILAAFVTEMSGADNVSNSSTVFTMKHLARCWQVGYIHLLLTLMPQCGCCIINIRLNNSLFA